MTNHEKLRDIIIKIMSEDEFNLSKSTDALTEMMINYGNYVGNISVKTGTFMSGTNLYMKEFLNHKS